MCTYVVFCVGKGWNRPVAIATNILRDIIVYMNVSGLLKNLSVWCRTIYIPYGVAFYIFTILLNLV